MSKGLSMLVGKWQFVWHFGQDIRYHDPFARAGQIGVFKIVRLPEPGSRLRRGQYKGFLIEVLYRAPIAIERNRK